MYINFEEISPTLLNTFSESFNLDSKNTTVLYKITNITENKFDDFEKSILFHQTLVKLSLFFHIYLSIIFITYYTTIIYINLLVKQKPLLKYLPKI